MKLERKCKLKVALNLKEKEIKSQPILVKTRELLESTW